MRKQQRNERYFLEAAITLALLAGPVPALAADSTQDAEYKASGGLELINAAAAYEQGYTGKGVTLGICDQPINFASPEFNQKQASSMVNTALYKGKTVSVYPWADLNHGTHVAGIAAASRNGIGMQGVAYDAEVMGSSAGGNYLTGGQFAASLTAFDAYLQDDAVKVINNSWGGGHYVDQKGNFDSSGTYTMIENAASQDKLVIFAAGNGGHPTPAQESLTGYRNNAAWRNILSVTNVDGSAVTLSGGRFTVSRGATDGLLSITSDVAKYAEDWTLGAPGSYILSANANFAADGQLDVVMSGTSMAAPFVTGTGALVQQAFPYLSAKQIGDVLLSTANSSVSGAEITCDLQQDEGKLSINAFVQGEKNTESEAAAKAAMDALNGELFSQYQTEVRHYYYNVPLQELIGQGIVDAGAAVKGPGALNARRLVAADRSEAYTVGGVATAQALYTVDTAGYDSVWSNAIKEIRADYIAKDSSEADLQERWKYYDTNWLSYTGTEDRATAIAMTKSQLKAYNDYVDATGLRGLHVGLYKTGAGTLSLTGTNTYAGTTVAAGGTLEVNGSVAGDAWSTAGGRLAGSGEVNGTGGIYNYGTLCGGSLTAGGTLTAAKLTSSGLIEANHAYPGSQVVINGEANINGSKVSLLQALPGDSQTVLTAGSITGTLANSSAANPYAASGMLSAYGTVDGTTITATAVAANNLGNADSRQAAAYSAMTHMYAGLGTADREQLRSLYNLTPAGTRAALSSIAGPEDAQLMALPQQSTLVSQALTARLMSVLPEGTVTVPAGSAYVTDEPKERDGVMALSLPGETSGGWLKFTKAWGDLAGGADYHGSAITLGYDKARSGGWRDGVFVSYNAMSYGAAGAQANLYDTRVGFYTACQQGRRNLSLYADFGWQRSHMDRQLTNLGLMASGSYDSRLWELGGEYKYDLHGAGEKIWQVSPYVNAQLSYLEQDGYDESGAGVYSHRVGAASNTYAALGAGVEFSRRFAEGSFAIRAGYRRTLTGADPELRFQYAGDSTMTYTMQDGQDKDHWLLGLRGEAPVAADWKLSGELSLEKGTHDQAIIASAALRYSW